MYRYNTLKLHKHWFAGQSQRNPLQSGRWLRDAVRAQKNWWRNNVRRRLGWEEGYEDTKTTQRNTCHDDDGQTFLKNAVKNRAQVLTDHGTVLQFLMQRLRISSTKPRCRSSTLVQMIVARESFALLRPMVGKSAHLSFNSGISFFPLSSLISSISSISSISQPSLLNSQL